VHRPNISHSYLWKSLLIRPILCDSIPEQCRLAYSEYPTYFHGYYNPVRHALPWGAHCLMIDHCSINRHAPRALLIVSSSSRHCASRTLFGFAHCEKRWALSFLVVFLQVTIIVCGQCLSCLLCWRLCVGGWLLMRTEELPTFMMCHLCSCQDTWIHIICTTWTKQTRKKWSR
jgi:hypothetical protein